MRRKGREGEAERREEKERRKEEVSFVPSSLAPSTRSYGLTAQGESLILSRPSQEASKFEPEKE